MRFAMAAVPVALAFFLGGWEWASMAGLSLALALRLRKSPAAMAAGSLLWLFAFLLVGDRRLFFPYSMQYAVQAAGLMTGLGARVGVGMGLIGAFLGIRVAQAASREVLIFETLVALAILAFSLQFLASGGRRMLIAALASVFAFVSLAL